MTLALVLAVAGCAALYLASPHQRWRARALPARPAVALGAACLGGSLWAFGRVLSWVPASFALLTEVMLLLALFPYLGAALRGSR